MPRLAISEPDFLTYINITNPCKQGTGSAFNNYGFHIDGKTIQYDVVVSKQSVETPRNCNWSRVARVEYPEQST